MICNQLFRSSTSVAANNRAATRARSQAEFYSKICIVIEEADESLFWLEMLEASALVKSEIIKPLKNVANEITAIVISIRKTIKNKLNNPKL